MARALLRIAVVLTFLFAGCSGERFYDEEFRWVEDQGVFTAFPTEPKTGFNLSRTFFVRDQNGETLSGDASRVMDIHHPELDAAWSKDGYELRRLSRGDFFLYYGSIVNGENAYQWNLSISLYMSDPRDLADVRQEFASFATNVTTLSREEAEEWARGTFLDSDEAAMLAATEASEYRRHVPVEAPLRVTELLADQWPTAEPSMVPLRPAEPNEPATNPTLCPPFGETRCPEGRPEGPGTLWAGDWTWEFQLAQGVASRDGHRLELTANGQALYWRSGQNKLGRAGLENALHEFYHDLGLGEPADVTRDYDRSSWRRT